MYNLYRKKTDREIFLERIKEEQKSFLSYVMFLEENTNRLQFDSSGGGDSDGDIEKTPTETPTNILNLWNFPTQSGAIIDNLNLTFNPSTTVEIDWGDGSQSQNINSGVNYNHTFN